MISTSFILVLLYSPVSSYFAGWTIEKFDGAEAQEHCRTAAVASIGQELHTTIMWEREMMGPVPTVIAAFCAEGTAAR